MAQFWAIFKPKIPNLVIKIPKSNVLDLKILKKVHSLLLEIEGKNLKENYSEIKHLLTIADLEEDIGWRNKGSKRNRLFLRK